MTNAFLLVITPHKITYSGIRSTLDPEIINLDIVWAEDYLCLLNTLKKPDISLFIVDCTGKPRDYLEIITVIKEKIPGAKILSIIEAENPDTELKLLSIGARGIITENTGFNLFNKAVLEVLEGNMWIRRKILERFVEKTLYFEEFCFELFENRFSRLSAKEIEILRLASVGLTNIEIAVSLFLTEKTVKNYLTHIYKKLHIRGRSEINTKVKPLYSFLDQ
ncbi:MAG: response regulator transcription factor [Thermodesulfobacteriota bacterium]